MRTKQPGIPKYTNINGPRPTAADNEAMAKTIYDASRAKANGGKMIQVAPPVLVIPVGVTGRVNSSTVTPSSQEEVEGQGGQ